MNKDEMNLKVNIDTKAVTKELKKLQKQLKKTKHLYKEVISLSEQLDELEVKHDRNIETVRALIQQVQSHTGFKVKKMYRRHAKDLNG